MYRERFAESMLLIRPKRMILSRRFQGAKNSRGPARIFNARTWRMLRERYIFFIAAVKRTPNYVVCL